MTEPTTVWLLRHGETEWNVEGRMQGHNDSPLTDYGLAAARAVARRLLNAAPSVIYTSDLGRAHRTAEEIAGATQVPVRTEARLREKNNGIFEGLTQAEVAERYPDEFARYKQRRLDYAPPGGESTAQLRDRAYATLTDLAARHPGERIVVVTHGGIISVFMRTLLGTPLTQNRRFAVDNCALNTLTFEAEQPEPWRLVTLNEVAHLQEVADMQVRVRGR
jgi:probable phosphoglycerate mutase